MQPPLRVAHPWTRRIKHMLLGLFLVGLGALFAWAPIISCHTCEGSRGYLVMCKACGGDGRVSLVQKVFGP